MRVCVCVCVCARACTHAQMHMCTCAYASVLGQSVTNADPPWWDQERLNIRFWFCSEDQVHRTGSYWAGQDLKVHRDSRKEKAIFWCCAFSAGSVSVLRDLKQVRGLSLNDGFSGLTVLPVIVFVVFAVLHHWRCSAMMTVFLLGFCFWSHLKDLQSWPVLKCVMVHNDFREPAYHLLQRIDHRLIQELVTENSYCPRLFRAVTSTFSLMCAHCIMVIYVDRIFTGLMCWMGCVT